MDISAVVVHYETPKLLQRCLDALQVSRDVTIETIVVDNASRNLDVDALRRSRSHVQVIRNDYNAGFARAANAGLRMASGRYLVLLNADTIVEPDTFKLMVDYMDARPRVGCATPRLMLEDGTLDLACRRQFPTPERALYRMTMLSRIFPRSRRFGQYNMTYIPEDRETQIDSPCGAFMMVRREVVKQVGLLDERYFMYGEDLDWAYRIKKAGWRVMYYPGARAMHVKRAASSRNRLRSIHAFYEAMRIFYRQHYESSYPRALSLIIYTGIAVREAVELLAARLGRLSGETR